MPKSSHPKTLFLFFSTEFWERYGFYVVQSLLALYLTKAFHLTDFETYTLVGSFTGLTYVSPIIGGMLADKLLGQKATVICGAIILLVNYLLLSMNLSFFMMTFALAGISCGTGLLKPNISSLLGRQYSKNSPKREAGFILFYMGITSGIILGTVLPPFIQRHLGWHTCFFSAAIGLAIALCIFYFGIKKYQVKDYAFFPRHVFYNRIKATLILLIMWDVAFLIISRPHFASLFFESVMIGTVGYVLWVVYQESNFQRKKNIVLLMLCIVSAMFWTFYFQMFLSLTLFISRVVQGHFLGLDFPPPYYIAVESFGMLLLGALLARARKEKVKTHYAVRTAHKFSLSLALMLLAYLVIVYAIGDTHSATLISPSLIILAYFIIAGAEILLSPIGLSAVTRLASPERVSTMMGVFFISLGVGGYFSGRLASVASISSTHAHSITTIKANYHHAFLVLSGFLFAAFIISLCLRAVTKHLMAQHPHQEKDKSKLNIPKLQTESIA